jgi:hypothetical protein
MKTHTKSVLLTLFIAAAGFVTIFRLEPPQARAADPPSAEQYKLFNLGDPKFSGIDHAELELNKFGAQGWKVRAGTGTLIILAK